MAEPRKEARDEVCLFHHLFHDVLLSTHKKIWYLIGNPNNSSVHLAADLKLR